MKINPNNPILSFTRLLSRRAKHWYPHYKETPKRRESTIIKVPVNQRVEYYYNQRVFLGNGTSGMWAWIKEPTIANPSGGARFLSVQFNEEAEALEYRPLHEEEIKNMKHFTPEELTHYVNLLGGEENIVKTILDLNYKYVC